MVAIVTALFLMVSNTIKSHEYTGWLLFMSYLPSTLWKSASPKIHESSDTFLTAVFPPNMNNCPDLPNMSVIGSLYHNAKIIYLHQNRLMSISCRSLSPSISNSRPTPYTCLHIKVVKVIVLFIVLARWESLGLCVTCIKLFSSLLFLLSGSATIKPSDLGCSIGSSWHFCTWLG